MLSCIYHIHLASDTSVYWEYTSEPNVIYALMVPEKNIHSHASYYVDWFLRLRICRSFHGINNTSIISV